MPRRLADNPHSVERSKWLLDYFQNLPNTIEYNGGYSRSDYYRDRDRGEEEEDPFSDGSVGSGESLASDETQSGKSTKPKSLIKAKQRERGSPEGLAEEPPTLQSTLATLCFAELAAYIFCIVLTKLDEFHRYLLMALLNIFLMYHFLIVKGRATKPKPVPIAKRKRKIGQYSERILGGGE